VKLRYGNFFLLSIFLTCPFFLYSSKIFVVKDCQDLDYSSLQMGKGYNDCNMYTNGEVDALNFFLREGQVVFDIGGNIGEWSENVLMRVNNVELCIFEPIPSLANLLKNKFRQKNVYINELAISSKETVQPFYYYGKEHGLSGLYFRECLEKLINEKPQKLLVRTTSLDKFCLGKVIKEIDYLKIDTEGSELDVLTGAESLLKRQAISIIQFEYGGAFLDSHATLEEVYRLLCSHGYQLYRIAPKTLIFLSEWRDELEVFQYSNYIALSPKAVKFLNNI